MKLAFLPFLLACLGEAPPVSTPPTPEQAVQYYQDCMSWGLGAAQCRCRTDAAVELTDFALMTLVNSAKRPVAEKDRLPLQAVLDQVFEMCKIPQQ